MRFVFFILLIQFVTSAYAQANIQEYAVREKVVYKDVRDTGICTGILFTEDSEEKSSNHTAILTAELIDFALLTTALTHYHSCTYWNISNLRHTRPPLFRLHCTLLI